MISRKYLFLPVLLIMALVLVLPAAAQAPQPSDDDVNAIAKQLYCPVCENIPLDVCPTQACVQWRQTIREKLTEGWDEAQIKAYFVEQYGDRVLAEPPRRGFNWLVYIIPPLAFLGGAAVLIRALWVWRTAESSTDVQEVPIQDDDEYLRRLEAELDNKS